MRSRSTKKNRVNVVTLGCSKNLYDSEVIMGQLKANDIDVIHEEEKPESAIVIINTCGFIENAKQESIDTILAYAEQRKKGKIDKLLVTGCLSERYQSDLKEEIKNVDGWFGTRDLPRLLKTLNADYKHELVGERLLTTPAHYAYLKIAEGCDRPCSFCAIPLMRGAHRSTPIEELCAQAKQLAEKGVKELILIAQDLTYYGLDIYKTRKLADLLVELEKIDGIEWIRLHYAFPAGFPLDVLDVMAKSKKICKYLDMPLQHISDEILASMRRGTTGEKTRTLINEIRKKVPGIAIRTTLIAGYPGEQEHHFEELLKWIQESNFERLGAFTYSHEENTHAYGLIDSVSEDVKKERVDRIMEVQSEISLQSNLKKVGKEFKVIIDRKEGDYYVGRTEFDSPDVDNEVLIPAVDNYLKTGNFYHVRITGAEPHDLFGVLV